jgi:hypothetical protein
MTFETMGSVEHVIHHIHNQCHETTRTSKGNQKMSEYLHEGEGSKPE